MVNESDNSYLCTLQMGKIPLPVGIKTSNPHLTQCILAPLESPPQIGLISFSRFCTAQALNRLIHHAMNIGRNRPPYAYCASDAA